MTIKLILKYLLPLPAFFVAANFVSAQQTTTEPLNLQKAVDAALHNNHLLKIKAAQVDEKDAKTTEAQIKRYPSVIVNSLYEYNENVGDLVIPKGSFGSLPLSASTIIPLPDKDKIYTLGEHNLFLAGVTLYQPVTQQFKINSGVEISKTDVLIAEKEKEKAVEQISLAVEKLYYGLLINQKQQVEAKAKLELAKMKLYDVESALAAKKTIDANKAGLQANIADEEQNVLKLEHQEDDYFSELKHLTGLRADRFQLEEVGMPTDIQNQNAIGQYQVAAASNNTDIQLAKLTQTKSELAIKAAKQSYLPDLGILAGYEYQSSYDVFPKNNPFAGVILTWNLQDIFSNTQVLKERNSLLQQAKENIANTEEQVNSDIEKDYRKLSQTQALITVAQKAVQYRKEELRVQTDRQAAGLNTKADVLNAQSALAKSEADLYAAQLSYRLALSDLKTLTEGNRAIKND